MSNKDDDNKAILNHILVPKFEVMQEEEAKRFLKDKRITKAEIPILRQSDPIVPLIKAKPGDIVKITRKAVFGGTYTFYRVVE